MGLKRRKSAITSQSHEDEPTTSGREHSGGPPRRGKRTKPSSERLRHPIEEGAYYALRINIKAGPIVPLAFEKDLFLKLHSGDDGLPKDRTLFVAGLPFVLAGPALAELLSVYGPIEKAAIHPDQTSALVLFEGVEGRDAALQAAYARESLEYDAPEPEGPWGLKLWMAEHKAQYPGNAVLQTQMNEWMENYEAEQERKRKEQDAAAQEDGWTVVKRHKGRHGDTAVGGVALAKATALGEAAQKKKRAEVDFYRFQERDKRRDELLDLRQQFEEDKKRVQELKASRKFKPI